MKRIIAITTIVALLWACKNSEDEFEKLMVILSRQTEIPEGQTRQTSTLDFKLVYPDEWRETITTDSSLTVDNNVLDSIDGYNIITVMSHKSDKPISYSQLETALKDYLKEHNELDLKVDQHINIKGEAAFVVITVDTDQVELLDSNVLVTYSLVDPTQTDRWIVMHAQSYGKERFTDQEEMKKIINSVVWR